MAIVAIVFSAYVGTVISIGVVLNLALLMKIKQKTKSLSREQSLDSSLTKTIGMIIFLMIAAYLPLMINLNIAACGLLVPQTKALPKKEQVICSLQQYHVKQMQYSIQSSI